MAKFEDYWHYDEPDAEKRKMMGTFATVFEDCRNTDCHSCSYSHGEHYHSMLQCMGERFCDTLIRAGYRRLPTDATQ